MIPGPTAPDNHARVGDEPRVVIEVRGPNVVIRSTSDVDQAYTASLADVINAAASTETCVVIDPAPIPCDDAFAAYEATATDRSCGVHEGCRPSAAEAAAAGVVRLHAECTVWLIDVGKGRFCRMDDSLDLRFLDEKAWRPLVAVCITPTRLIALGTDGNLTSARRAHLAPAA
jgi:hypothetical protein